jgi:high-affinity Fe2+/Pb2+ permease
MFRSKRNKEQNRYYLLPGMGRSNRRRHRQFLVWAVVVGTVVSCVFAYLLYLLSRHYY